MAIVKGKKCLCKTSLQDWNPERVNGPWFYERYPEFVKVFAKVPGVDFEKCFAQPVINEEIQSIEWFSALTSNICTLDQVPNAEIEAEKNRITNLIKTTAQSLSENDRKYLNPVLKTLLSADVDKITYYADGQLVFGIWGMSMKKGKVISDVIIDDVKDHHTYPVTFSVQGKGSLTFDDIVRKRGHVLGVSDIPKCTPDEGYIAKEWIPDSPFGMLVDKALNFTMVFERDPNYQSASPGDGEESTMGVAAEPSIGTDVPESAPEDPDKPQDDDTDKKDEKEYKVTFVTDDRGELQGTLEYSKKENEQVLASEIPTAVPKEGYRFVCWDKTPVDHVVTEDVVFTAQYEAVEATPVGFWSKPWGCLSGCLSWLLALLLLALIGLLLWFLLADHNLNFCGNECDCDCDCKPEVLIDTVYPPTPPPHPDPDPTPPKHDPKKPKPVKKPCDEQFHQGSNNPESYIISLGQTGGTFDFEYNTGNMYPDKIVIYDGNSRSNRIIFEYHGVTGDINVNERISFSKESILVDITPDKSPKTYWSVQVHCPN